MVSDQMSEAPSRVRSPEGQLLGREDEREALDRLLERVRDGHGGVLVVHGEPASARPRCSNTRSRPAPGFAWPVRSGSRVRWTRRSQLCSSCAFPFLELTERLPPPQRDALAVAVGLNAGPAPNPFLVGMAVLGLLAEVAEEQPLLCVVDDAQWLDSASARTLAFVARRLFAEKIALVFATREARATSYAGLPDLAVRPGRRDAGQLLPSVLRFGSTSRRVGRLVIETHGNPLALLELPQGLTPTQLAGGLGAQRERCFGRAGSRRVSPGGWKSSPMTRACCCCSRRRSRSAIRCCCGARPRSSVSRPSRGG